MLSLRHPRTLVKQSGRADWRVWGFAALAVVICLMGLAVRTNRSEQIVFGAVLVGGFGLSSFVAFLLRYPMWSVRLVCRWLPEQHAAFEDAMLELAAAPLLSLAKQITLLQRSGDSGAQTQANQILERQFKPLYKATKNLGLLSDRYASGYNNLFNDANDAGTGEPNQGSDR